MRLDVAAHHATLFEIFLVILFGLPKGGRRNDLGCDGLAVRACSTKFCDLGAGLGKLLVGASEDDAAVLCAPVRTLAVDLGGIVKREESVQQCVVGNTGWIEGY